MGAVGPCFWARKNKSDTHRLVLVCILYLHVIHDATPISLSCKLVKALEMLFTYNIILNRVMFKKRKED